MGAKSGCEPDLLITCSHYDESDGIRVTTSLNNVFLITNRLKVNSIFWLIISFTNVLLVFIYLNTTSLGIYAVAGVSKVTGILGNLIFVPLYACKCLKIKWNTFYQLFSGILERHLL